MQEKVELVIQGRVVCNSDIDEVRDLLESHPDWSRWKLSRYLSEKWNWRNGRGQLKDMACRAFLLKLEQRGYIKLPQRRCASPNRMSNKSRLMVPVLHSTQAIESGLKSLQPLSILPLYHPHNRHYQPLFNFFLFKYHYLSYRGCVGENLQYVVLDRFDRPLCCLLFGSSAWKVSGRDDFIGWDARTRRQNVNLITNNMRFLILPWVRVKYLASHILSQVCRRVGGDWQEKYGHGVYLLETFVESDRFSGISYKAANWHFVGQTRGRSRNDRKGELRVPVKDIYVYPLVKNFRRYLKAIKG
jgi:hypothetical protein